LTLDTILSTAFGVQTDYQRNPNDPIMEVVKRALNISPFMQGVLLFLSMMPFGEYMLASENFTKFLFKDTFEMLEYAQGVVDLKKREGSTRKVTTKNHSSLSQKGGGSWFIFRRGCPIFRRKCTMVTL